jgi:YMGG-like Gly-zipper
MKQILFTLTTLAIFLTACNSEKKDGADNEKRIVFTDTAQLRTSNASTDRATNVETLAPETTNDNTKPKVITITKYVRVAEKKTAPRRRSANNQQQSSSTQSDDNSSLGDAPSAAEGGNDGGAVATTPAEPAAKKNEGWSQAAKGATIGGVGGAVAGAVISKKKGKGAVIGGVIGAAGGYILGRKADKKSGRANYVKK